jgi:type I restriction enzyme S subunit
MATAAKIYSIAELLRRGVLAINDGYRAKNSELTDHGIPFARAQNINDGFHFEDADRFPEASLQRIGNKISAPGDVVFTSKGTVGRLAFVSNDTPRFVYAPQLCFWRSLDPQAIEARWLFYWMQSREFFIQYKGVAGQTDMADYVSLGDQRQMSITLPIIEEQRAIAGILGALDDKIELKRRMNQTLEGMARAMFKSWFVDFDPVRAKAAGKKPAGLSPDIAKLFPDSFEDSELGEIPKEWTVGSIGAVASEVRDSVHPADIKPGTPYIALEHMPRRSIAIDSWGVADEIASGKLRFKTGDILFGKLRPYFHKVGPAPLDGVCSTDIVVCRPKAREWNGLALCHLSSDDFVAHSDRGSTGTKMPRTNWRDMSAYKIAMPPEGIAGHFTELVCPMVERIRKSLFEQQTLAALRDTLLPKLMSGELRIPVPATMQMSIQPILQQPVPNSPW